MAVQIFGDNLKTAIVGPGALGSLLAAHLTESGCETVLLDHRPERAEFINKRGLIIEYGGKDRRVKLTLSADPSSVAKADLVVVCVKAYQTEIATRHLAPFLKQDAVVLTLQNGLGNVETLIDIFGEKRVWGGVTAQGATWLGLGQIRHAGTGDTVIASVSSGNNRKELDRVASMFTLAGLPTHTESSVNSLIWSKLIVNVGINPLTAITRLRNGQLLEHPGTADVMEKAVTEAMAVAEALGITLLYPDPLERVRQVARATAENIASMLQDIRAMRPTEIDAINGAVAAKGRELGIPTPVNDTLAGLVKTLENSYGYTV